jgi:hypothetical protein
LRWNIGKPKKEIRGEIVEYTPDEFDGKVTTSIVVNAVDRQTREVRIIIIEKQTEEVVFKAEYKSNQNEHLSYETARDIVRAFVRANDYFIDNEITNVEKGFVGNANKRSR